MNKNSESIDILRELEPTVEKELNRHESMAEEWHPHDFVPWAEGKNFSYLDTTFPEMHLGGEDWDPIQSKLGKVAKTAMYVNLLTEDNLPSYHYAIRTEFGEEGPWGTWVHRWTSEENKHAMVMRDYLMVTRAIDPIALEKARMQHMGKGYSTGGKTPLDAIAYVTLQELATRIAHRNTGLESAKDGDILADHMMNRVAKDENLHMIFYRNIGKAALDIAPNETMQSIAKEVIGFSMPGDTIPDFYEHAAVISEAGIYNLQLHHDEVVAPTLRYWNALNREGLTGDGAAAQDKLGRYMDKFGKYVLTLDKTAPDVIENRESAEQSR